MRVVPALIASILLTGCTATIEQASLLPVMKDPVAAEVEPLAGYVRQEQMLALPDLGVVHVARLKRPGNRTTLIYSGGNGSFIAAAGGRLNRLAELSGADVLTFDYPGRGGTTVPRITNALIAFGPALVAAFRQAGWINAGPTYSYGMSFGGATASNIARTGGFSGLVLEATAADISAVARNMISAVFKPFIRIKVSDDLKQYDYIGDAAAARPILVIAGTEDKTVDPKTAERFVADLKSAGCTVTFIQVPGAHGAALSSEQGRIAVRRFLQVTRM